MFGLQFVPNLITETAHIAQKLDPNTYSSEAARYHFTDLHFLVPDNYKLLTIPKSHLLHLLIYLQSNMLAVISFANPLYRAENVQRRGKRHKVCLIN